MRDLMPRAQAMNRAAWKDYPHGCSAAFVAALEAKADRSQARYLEERRERIVATIAECVEFPSMFWRHRYFAGLRGSCVATTDEAVVEIKSALAAEKARKGHWSHKPERVAILSEAIVFARFFRRYSRRAWARSIAA